MIIIDGYRIDAEIKTGHSHPSEVTKLPIEEGSDTSDHNRVLNDIVTIEGIVSDTPIGDIEAIRDLDGATKPSDEARTHLLKLRATRRPVTIVTSRAVYESMAMVGFESTDSIEDSGGLFFTAKFEQQRITKVERVVAVPRAENGENLGNRPPKYFEFSTNSFLHDLATSTWLDPDLTVYVKGTPGVDIDVLKPGDTGAGLRRFDCWRKSSKYDQKNKIYKCTKGPLLDGFYGTDAQMCIHIKGLTAEQRKKLIPPNAPGSNANTSADYAKRAKERKDKLRVDNKGNVFTMSPSDPRWKDTKPFVPK